MPSVSLTAEFAGGGSSRWNATVVPSFAPCAGAPPTPVPPGFVTGADLVLAPPPPPGCEVQPLRTVPVTNLLTPRLAANVAAGPLLTGVDIVCPSCSLGESATCTHATGKGLH